MPVAVARGFLGEILLKRRSQVDPRLVCDAHKHPKHIGKLVGESVGILTLLERLVAIAPRHYARHLAHLFREHRHICQFAEIAHSVFAYPAVHFLLSFLDGHSVILLDASQ